MGGNGPEPSGELLDEYRTMNIEEPRASLEARNELRRQSQLPLFQFRDGLIIRHHDKCNALRWGIQALGPVKGVLSWLVPASRRAKAKEKLDAFIRTHPEYQTGTHPTGP